MLHISYLMAGGGACLLFISLASLRSKSQIPSPWGQKLVLPPKWLTPAFGLIPSIQANPRAVPRSIVFLYWFSVVLIISFIGLAPFVRSSAVSVMVYFALSVVMSLGAGLLIAVLAGHYWPFKE